MKSYERSCGEIYTKANKQIAGICQFKRKLKMIITPVVSVGVLLAIMLSMTACTNGKIAQSPGDSIDNINNFSENDTTISDTLSDKSSDKFLESMPSIYPSAWKGMNAVIVKWGETNDQARNEMGVDYVGVDVEFVTVFSETMSKSNIDGIERIIEKSPIL